MGHLIDTSLVSGYFAKASNNEYIAVFSFHYFDPRTVLEFSKKFFAAQSANYHHILRK